MGDNKNNGTYTPVFDNNLPVSLFLHADLAKKNFYSCVIIVLKSTDLYDNEVI